MPLNGSVAAVSCGVVDGQVLLDLDYSEDSRAEVDANVVMSGDGGLVEVQATAERTPVSRASLDELLGLAEPAIALLGEAQREGIAARRPGDAAGAARGRDAQPAQGARAGPDPRLARARAAPEDVELPPEDGETFAENALGKARAVQAATGLATIADDSGIEARALGGEPGVRSARYAGPRASDEREPRAPADPSSRTRPTARSRTRACWLTSSEAGEEQLFEGRCEGELAREPRGTGGSGTTRRSSPTTQGPEDRRTMAELSPAEKHAISHRGRAAPPARRLARGALVIRTKSGAAMLSVAFNSS